MPGQVLKDEQKKFTYWADEYEYAWDVAFNWDDFISILDEHNVTRQQREFRVKLLKELAGETFNDNKSPNGVVAYLSHGTLNSADIPILGDVLMRHRRRRTS